MPTGLATFRENMLFRGDATRHTATTFSLPMHVWRERTEERQGQVVESLAVALVEDTPHFREEMLLFLLVMVLGLFLQHLELGLEGLVRGLELEQVGEQTFQRQMLFE